MALDISTARLDIAKIYIAAFNRVPDSDGLNFWVNAYLNGASLASIASGFATSTEYTTKYPSYQTNTEYVAAVYQNVFGRAVDTDGSKFWTGALNAGTLTKAGLLNSLVSAAAANGSTDGARLTNQAEFGVYCASNNIQWTNATTALSAITSDTATVTTAKTTVSTNEANTSHILTTGQDTPIGTSGNDEFRAVAGATTGTQDQTTLNSSDIIDGGAGTDTLIVNMTGATYNGGARIKNIEMLQIGTDLATAAFDYNVNEGSNEITEVTKIVADQINTGETLTVNNVLKTSSALPTLAWENDSNTAYAGTVNYGYRAAQVTGTTDAQAVSLKNVNNGVLNIGAGIETITIESTGSGRNTLAKSTNADTSTNAVAADIISTGTLTKVVLTGSQEIGMSGKVITSSSSANRGYTDHTANFDTSTLTTAELTNTTQANLLSVGARVTEVDASAMTAATNVRFTEKTDGATTNVTFKGGSAADYVEFGKGAVSATGGEGSDTFAFVTTLNGVTNSSFTSDDSLTGGTGTDTIQIGLNGAGTYTIGTSEFANKTGIDALDVRGATNTITLGSSIVAGAEAGKFTVYTNKVSQTSDTDATNIAGLAATTAEDALITNLDLRQLAGNTIKLVGGSGSDRVVMSDSTFVSGMELDGGTQGAAPTAGDYDTITVVDSAIIDRNDLANVKGFEGLVLVESGTGNNTFRVDLTEAFLLANTSSSNDTASDMNDTVFQIGTATGSNGNALDAGDTVTIDVTDLYTVSSGVEKSTLSGRAIDVTSLTNAGVTVNYSYNNTTYGTQAALDAVVGSIAFVQGSDTTAQASVITAAAANVPAAETVALVAGATHTGTGGVNSNFTGNYASLSSSTITGTATDTETLTITDAVAAAIGGGGAAGTITNIDNLVLANVANTAVTFGGTTGITSITGGTAADTITLGALGATVSANLGAGGDTLTMTTGTAYTGTFNGGDGSDTLKVDTSTATDISGATVTNFETLTLTTGVAGAGLTVDSSVNLGQFTTLKDDTTNAAFTISITSGSHDISAATLGFNATTPDIFDVATGASLTIAGDTQATAANYKFTGAGTLNSTATVTLAATDTITNVTLTGSSAANVTDAGVAVAHTITGNSANNTITLGDITAAKSVVISSGGSDTLVFDNTAAASSAAVTVTGFQVGATASGGDVIDLGIASAVALTTIALATGGNIAGLGTAAANTPMTSLVALSNAQSQVVGSFTDASVKNAIINGALNRTAGSDFMYIAVDNGTDTAIYRVNLVNAGASNTVVDSTADFTAIQQVAVLSGIADVGSLIAANIA